MKIGKTEIPFQGELNKNQQDLLLLLTPYIKNPAKRATTEYNVCCNITVDGRRCAVAQTWTKRALNYVSQKFEGRPYSNTNVREYVESEPSRTLKKFRNINIGVKISAQEIHDIHEYWDSEGLTERGVTELIVYLQGLA